MKAQSNKKYFLKKIFLTIVSGMVVSLLAVFFLQFFHFQFDFNKTVEFIDYQTKLSLLQAMVTFVLYMWFYFLTASNAFSSFVLLFFTMIIGIGTQQKSVYRGEPLYPSDVYFLKDFTFLLEMVDVGIVISIFVVFVALIAGLVLYFKKRRKPHLTKKLKIARIVSFAVTTLLLIYIYQFNQPGNKVKAIFNDYVEWISYSQERNYSQNGVVSGLMYNLKSPAVNRPDGYSKEKIQELFEKYSNEANEINSTRTGSISDYNVVFIMNETFSDPLKIEGMKISEDPMPLYRELIKSNVSGQALSQGYGGGTANIEFEALTGISLEPLSSNITTPFIQLSGQMKDLPTIVDTMKENKLNLTAIHPYNTTMYKRLENYQALGFDNYLFQDDMKYTDQIDENTFISDEAAYKEVLEVIDSSEEKDFVHLVTMQNHKPFVHKYEDVEFTVEGAPYNLEVAHYAKGIQYSDYALDEFLKEIDTLDERTIVVFWGDHLPSFYGNELFELNGHVTMHETPLMLYTNFSEDARDIGTISPMFFIGHVLEQANAPVSPFVALLQKLEVVLPAFEKGIYLERETKLQYNRKDLKASTQLLLNDYDLILYDITTGKNYSRELGFY